MKKIYFSIVFALLGWNASAQCGGNPVPVVDFGFTNVCEGSIVNFNDLSTISSGSISSLEWNFDDNSPQSTSVNPSHLYAISASYNVKLVVISNLGCKDSITKTIIVSPNPDVNFTIDTHFGCPVHCANFTDLSNIGGGDNIVTWSWNFGDGGPGSTLPNPSNCFSQSGFYDIQLTATSNQGCFATLTITQDIQVYLKPNASFAAQPETAIISNPIISFTDSSSADAAQWHWNFGDNTISSTQYPPPHTYPHTGTYMVTLVTINQDGCADTAFQIVSIEPNKIWAGDADGNAIVNNNDLLPIGLYYGQTGIPRTSVSNVWQADSVINWGITENNGVDIKHADCNGDGTINVNDTLAINLNFNLAHSITTTGDTPYIERSAYDLYFVTNGSLFNAGDWVDAEVWLGSSTSPISNFYGVAFNISYDASIVQPGTESITYPVSWLGTPGTDAIKINKVDAITNTAYGAVTRIDHTDVSGYGKIADFKFQIKTSLTSSVAVPLYISNYMAYNAAGIEQIFTTSVTKINTSYGMSVYPNPFSFQTTIEFNEYQKNTTIKIMDVLGKEVKTINFTGKQLLLEKGEMKKGIYFVQVVDSNKNVVNKKIVVQ